jgi:recombination protein RecA
LVELSGQGESAPFTTAVAIVVQAQHEGETVAWVQFKGGSLFPPDLDESGVDLDSLGVVHVALQSGVYAIIKAAELLLRSGGFGLVVLDFCGRTTQRVGGFCRAVWGQVAWQGRLLALAHEHHSRVVCLTDTPSNSASLGPLIGLRIESQRVREARGRFAIEHRVLKDKLGLGFQATAEQRRAPWGLW